MLNFQILKGGVYLGGEIREKNSGGNITTLFKILQIYNLISVHL